MQPSDVLHPQPVKVTSAMCSTGSKTLLRRMRTPCRIDHEDAAGGHHGELFGAVGVEHERAVPSSTQPSAHGRR